MEIMVYMIICDYHMQVDSIFHISLQFLQYKVLHVAIYHQTKTVIDSGSHIPAIGRKMLCTTFFSLHSKHPLLLQSR